MIGVYAYYTWNSAIKPQYLGRHRSVHTCHIIYVGARDTLVTFGDAYPTASDLIDAMRSELADLLFA